MMTASPGRTLDGEGPLSLLLADGGHFNPLAKGVTFDREVDSVAVALSRPA